jgi:hypothetical protein
MQSFLVGRDRWARRDLVTVCETLKNCAFVVFLTSQNILILGFQIGAD